MSLAEFGWKLCATGLIFVPALFAGLMGAMLSPAKIVPLLPPLMGLVLLFCLAFAAIGAALALLGHLLSGFWKRKSD
jgi:hypothetical protein